MRMRAPRVPRVTSRSARCWQLAHESCSSYAIPLEPRGCRQFLSHWVAGERRADDASLESRRQVFPFSESVTREYIPPPPPAPARRETHEPR